MLTEKQRTCLDFIDSYIHANGYSPSFAEIRDALGLHSKGGTHRLIAALEERGFIRRLKYRARSIEIIKFPKSSLALVPDDVLLLECHARGLLVYAPA